MAQGIDGTTSVLSPSAGSQLFLALSPDGSRIAGRPGASGTSATPPPTATRRTLPEARPRHQAPCWVVRSPFTGRQATMPETMAVRRPWTNVRAPIRPVRRSLLFDGMDVRRKGGAL